MLLRKTVYVRPHWNSGASANVLGVADEAYHLVKGDRFGTAHDDDYANNSTDTSDDWTGVDEITGETVPTGGNNFVLAAGVIAKEHLPKFSDTTVFQKFMGPYTGGGLSAGEYEINYSTATVYTGSTLNGGTVDYLPARILKCPSADTNHGEDYYFQIIECEDQERLMMRGWESWNAGTHVGTNGSVPFGYTGIYCGPNAQFFTDGSEVSDNDTIDLWIETIRQGGNWPRVSIFGEGDTGVSGVQGAPFLFEELDTYKSGDTTGAVIIGPAYQGNTYKFKARYDPLTTLEWTSTSTSTWLTAPHVGYASMPGWGLTRGGVTKFLRYIAYMYLATEPTGAKGVRGRIQGVMMGWQGGWVNKDYTQDGSDVRRLIIGNEGQFNNSTAFGRVAVILEE